MKTLISRMKVTTWLMKTLKVRSVDEIIDAAKDVRSEVKIAQQNVELAEKDLQIAKSAYYPRISAFFGYSTRYTNSQIVFAGIGSR